MNASDFVDVLSKGGWTGYVVIAVTIIYSFLKGTVRSDREVKETLVERDKKYDAMVEDRDKWKEQATVALRSLEQLTGVMESAQTRGVKR